MTRHHDTLTVSLSWTWACSSLSLQPHKQTRYEESVARACPFTTQPHSTHLPHPMKPHFKHSDRQSVVPQSAMFPTGESSPSQQQERRRRTEPEPTATAPTRRVQHQLLDARANGSDCTSPSPSPTRTCTCTGAGAGTCTRASTLLLLNPS